MKGENDTLKKGKNVADKVIKNLQQNLSIQTEELNDVKKISEEKEKLNFEKESLEKEVIEIQKQNISKEEALKSIMIEMKVLKEKLNKFEEKDTDEKNWQTDVLKHEEKNLQTDDIMVEKISVSSECDQCGETFVKKRNVNKQLKNIHEEVKTKIYKEFR